MEICVGIDLGITNTLVSAEKKGKITCLKFGRSTMLPSVIYVEENGEVVVGEKAIYMGNIDIDNIIKLSETFRYHNKEYLINGQVFTLKDVATEILKVVKETVIKRLKTDEIDIQVIISVPTYLTSYQINEVRKAGEVAGLNIMDIITNATASIVGSKIEKQTFKNILVMNMNNEEFEISVSTYKDNSYEQILKETYFALNESIFTQYIIDYFLEIIEEDLWIDLSSLEKSGLSYEEYHSTLGRIADEAEKTKVGLSDEDEVEILINNIFIYKSYNFETVVNQEIFYKICKKAYLQLEYTIKKFLCDIDTIDEIIIRGDIFNIPIIRTKIESLFDKHLYIDEDYLTLASRGACIIANS